MVSDTERTAIDEQWDTVPERLDLVLRDWDDRLRWDEVKQRYALRLRTGTIEHPANRSQVHSLAHPRELSDEVSARWYPVSSWAFESYGDLTYRVVMTAVLPALAVEGTYRQARHRFFLKTGGVPSHVGMLDFRAADEGRRIERYSATGRRARLEKSVEIVGFEVRGYYQEDSLWCPEGLNQARRILGEINGSPRLLGIGLPRHEVHIINESEYRELVTRDFDRGEVGVRA